MKQKSLSEYKWSIDIAEFTPGRVTGPRNISTCWSLFNWYTPIYNNRESPWPWGSLKPFFPRYSGLRPFPNSRIYLEGTSLLIILREKFSTWIHLQLAQPRYWMNLCASMMTELLFFLLKNLRYDHMDSPNNHHHGRNLNGHGSPPPTNSSSHRGDSNYQNNSGISGGVNSPYNHNNNYGGDGYQYGRFDASALHIAHALKQTELQKGYSKAREKPIDYYLVSTTIYFFENSSFAKSHPSKTSI